MPPRRLQVNDDVRRDTRAMRLLGVRFDEATLKRMDDFAKEAGTRNPGLRLNRNAVIRLLVVRGLGCRCRGGS